MHVVLANRSVPSVQKYETAFYNQHNEQDTKGILCNDNTDSQHIFGISVLQHFVAYQSTSNQLPIDHIAFYSNTIVSSSS